MVHLKYAKETQLEKEQGQKEKVVERERMGGGGERRDVERGRDTEMKWDEMRNTEQRSFTIITATQQ